MERLNEPRGKRPHPWRLWYEQPAAKWEEALPIGNGRIGGMVFGGIATERIALNEDTLWSGFPRDTINYEALRYLRKARELIKARRFAEAEQLIEAGMLGRETESYLPLGDLCLDVQECAAEAEEIADYVHELDLDAGIAATSYRVGGGEMYREAFVSAPDQVLVVRFTPRDGLRRRIAVALQSPLQVNVLAENDGLALCGRCPSHIAGNYNGDHPKPVLYEEGMGIAFCAALRVLPDGRQQVTAEGGQLIVTGAGSFTLLLAAHTGFAGFAKMPSGDVDRLREQCRRRLAAAAAKGYARLRKRHIAEHRRLFRRVALHLGSTSQAALPTDRRLRDYGAGKPDPQLEALYFQYGRYLLLACSQPGTQPANLQGIWNPYVQPPWNCNYTININTQMNYWPAETCNLHECHEPLIRMIAELSVSGRRTAALHYDCRGWAAHHNVDLWRMSTPANGQASWAFWPLGGVWLCRHLWEHYLFQPDREYLRTTAYPLLKGAALFCLDWLEATPAGELLTLPSTSPENKFLLPDGAPCSISMASTMDISLIRELFTHCMAAAEILSVDEGLVAKLKNAVARLPSYRIGRHGQLQEWYEDFAEYEPGHRHVSHLYGLYPGEQITVDDCPDLAAAAEKTLQRRLEHGGGHTGWSRAWLVNLYARLHDGANAYRHLRALISRHTLGNLFANHPPLQIDGNFGGTAGIAEMLLQSRANTLELLPALPAAWPDGAVSGLKARGGFTVSIRWRGGRLVQAQIAASVEAFVRVRYREPLQVQKRNGAALSPAGFAIAAGETVTILPAVKKSR
ncbi:MAG TPA: glycoside hydrolase family 95 protein [Bacilli bacterium]